MQLLSRLRLEDIPHMSEYNMLSAASPVASLYICIKGGMNSTVSCMSLLVRATDNPSEKIFSDHKRKKVSTPHRSFNSRLESIPTLEKCPDIHNL